MKYLPLILAFIYIATFIVNPSLNKNALISANIFYAAFIIMQNSDENMKVIKTWLENQQNPVKEEEEDGQQDS